MISLEYMCFDEATVTGFYKYDALLKLELEDVLVGERKSDVVVTVSAVTNVFVDGELSDESLMAAEDGEVLSLELSDDGFLLIIEWNIFTPRRMFTKSYKIVGGNVSVSVA